MLRVGNQQITGSSLKLITMFKKLFSKKSRAEVLNKKYQKLLHSSFELSKVNRIKSDQKMAEAEAVLNKLKSLEKAN